MFPRTLPFLTPPAGSHSSFTSAGFLGPASVPHWRSNSATLCFHNFANPSSRLPAHIDFYFHHFHALTNRFFRKSFVLINICVAPWYFSREFVPFRYLHVKTSQVLCIHTMVLFVVAKKVIRIGINNFHALLQKHPGVWVRQHDS
jgi:hypothetical protein